MARLEASDEIRRRIHIKVGNLWGRRNKLSGSHLKSKATVLKTDIEQYIPWSACTIFCPINPYWKYTDLTERIREMIVLGIARIRGNKALETGIKSGEAAAERFRGGATSTEKGTAFAFNPIAAAIAALTGSKVPGGGSLDPLAAETGKNIPGEVEDSWCCMKRAFVPIPGIFDCKCSDPNHPANTLRWFIWIGIAAALLFILHPYVTMLSTVIRKK